MGVACSMHWKDEKCFKILVRKCKGMSTWKTWA